MIDRKNGVLKWLIDQPDHDEHGDRLFKIEEWHPKRTLTANAYYWALIGKLAQTLRTSKDELHESLLFQYGEIEGTEIEITTGSVSRLKGHWVRTNDGKYLQMKGSSEMDSRAFSALLDGLIYECREQGIEVMPDSEIQRLRGYVHA